MFKNQIQSSIYKRSPFFIGLVFAFLFQLGFTSSVFAQDENNTQPIKSDDSPELCPIARSNIEINVCMAVHLDNQKAEIKDLVTELQNINQRLNAPLSESVYYNFQNTFCDSYHAVYKANSSLMGTSIAYCKYDLNVAFIDQLRILRSQSRGRGRN
jgi:hypothetical protein